MKGPFERLKYDGRRIWECPACNHHERTHGDVVAQICKCQKKIPSTEQVCMRLVEDGVRRVH